MMRSPKYLEVLQSRVSSGRTTTSEADSPEAIFPREQRKKAKASLGNQKIRERSR